MEQIDFVGVASPCVGVCSVDDKGYCQGCMRRREERFQWNEFSDAQKQHIIKLCRQRYIRKHRKVKAQPTTTEDTSPEAQQQSLF